MDISNIKTEFGFRLRTFRRNQKMTQEKFSELINFNPQNLSNIENGKTYPDFITLCSIIENGNISPDYLLGFLKNNKEKTSLDIEIIKLITDLPEKQKAGLLAFLSSLKK